MTSGMMSQLYTPVLMITVKCHSIVAKSITLADFGISFRLLIFFWSALVFVDLVACFCLKTWQGFIPGK